MRRMPRRWTMSLLIGVVLCVPAAAAAQTTPVLAVVPQGAVIDAAAFPDLAVGATFSFRRAGGDATELAHGAVTDVRDGKALIDLSGSSGVNAGDVALRCATAASQTQLRASLDQIKAQTTASTATPDVQRILGDLDTTVQARESAVNSGTCDVSALDQKLAELGAQLQQAMTPSSSSGSSASSPSGTTTTAGVTADTTTTSSTTTGTTGATETTGTTSGTAGTSTGATGDSLEQAFQLMSKLFKLVQGLGSGDGKSRSDGDAGSTSQTGSGAIGPAPQPPTFNDPGAASTPTPPPTAAAPLPSPSAPTTDVVTAPSPSQPPSVGGGPGTAPSTGTPPPVTTPPPTTATTPPPTATPPPPASTGAAPPTSGAPPRVVTPSPPPWWTVAKPKPVAPPSSGNAPSSGSAPSGGNAPSTPAPTNPLQGIVIHPGTTVPGGLRPIGPIAAARPGVIHGRVLGDIDGRPGVEPLRGASVLISDGPGGTADRRATTNDSGGFTFAGLAAGRYSVVATAAGFRSATVTISVAPGDDVPMSLTLQRQAAPAAPTPARPRPAPVHVPPPHTRTQSP